ncbi:NUDIX domain-containing protein [Rubripirellula amarantea]|uniref:Bis(5'-nucleosyl)-tetraphosphatase [asymmetrical] n=1 Tax=Rubripirellula amarantea TaxID=2527999 RepID=A0A5C5WS24_9BACT|nr:NUDIX domain-containing protein [Rubripirellula amarantea]MDA8744205.1 NUDIX domain-containing protein [Rubripirellula amarantea]TWT53280.1 Diadenosine hexaphosphate hydrolase [Rubripirellula amarantea]
MNDHQVRAAGFIVMCKIDGNPHVLLMRHAKRWDFPKGHCDGDESFEEAAFRELEEETGISREIIEMDPDFHFDLQYEVTYKRHGKQRFQKLVRYYLGYLDHEPEIEVTEHEGFQWLPWAPPHQIQTQTIDAALAAVAMHLSQ